MKKAVIITGGKQYLVSEGQTLEVDHLKDAKKSLEFIPILVLDGEKTTIGTPEVSAVKVTADVTEPLVRAAKVTSIRYKAKKRVSKVRGQRAHQTRITIKKIA